MALVAFASADCTAPAVIYQPAGIAIVPVLHHVLFLSLRVSACIVLPLCIPQMVRLLMHDLINLETFNWCLPLIIVFLAFINIILP